MEMRPNGRLTTHKKRAATDVSDPLFLLMACPATERLWGYAEVASLHAGRRNRDRRCARVDREEVGNQPVDLLGTLRIVRIEEARSKCAVVTFELRTEE